MKGKLDPHLLLLVEEAASDELKLKAGVVIMAALENVPDDVDIERLKKTGLQLRSTAGDVLTGTIRVGDLTGFCLDPLVLAVEGSRFLEAEAGEQSG